MAYIWDITRVHTNLTVLNDGVRLAKQTTVGLSGGAADFFRSSGKWYWEVDLAGVNSPYYQFIGVVNENWTPGAAGIGADAYGWGYQFGYGRAWWNNVYSVYGEALSTGDIIGFAIDIDAGNMWVSKNGAWLGGGNPVTGVNPGWTGISGNITPAAALYHLADYVDKAFFAEELTYPNPDGFASFAAEFYGKTHILELAAEIGASTMSPGISETLSISAEIGGNRAESSRSIDCELVLAASFGANKETNRGIDVNLRVSGTLGATNITKWIQANADHVVYRYFARLTGGPDGLADHQLSGLKSIQFRMRNGEPSYLSVVLKYDSTEAEAIAARQNGQVVVEMAGFIDGLESLREELIRANYYSHRYDRGASSQSITLVGYDTREYPSNRVALENVTRETQLADGRMQYRCAKPDFYLRPGDVAIYGPHEITIGTVTCIISSSSQYMEVAEAQV